MNTPNTALPSGTLLRGGTYRIERVLGQGGFGITYLAIEPDLERYVAIKEFFPKDFCDRTSDATSITLGSTGASELVSRLKSKFIKEARNIVKFNHSNVIRVLAAFEENNTAYYVMDYVEGESLRELVRTQGPLPVERAVRYVTEIGRALEYIHSQKVSHLDVKPANIMLRENDDTPVLIDFGLSKQYDSNGGQTSTTPVGFTHGFAPLEQYAGVPEFSPKVDLYALAATLYYLITGNTPLQASTLLDSELTFPANFPAHLMQPILKAMSVTPALRQPSVASFLAEITSRDTIPNEIKLPEISNQTGDTTIAANQPKIWLPGENDNPKSGSADIRHQIIDKLDVGWAILFGIFFILEAIVIGNF